MTDAGVCIITPLSRISIRVALGLALGLTVPSIARAQASESDLSSLTIEQLFEVELTSTASKFAQEVTQAPASVTVVTAEQIREHGYRTLADILGSVPGLYTTYDRNYSYVGVRGFARPGDYNTRVLLLVDGHRLNEPVYDMAPIGTDFPIEVSLIDRVEVIRGPGSSLYGTSAFFAVINVLTKNGASAPGARADISFGSLGTQRAVASVGQVFENGNEMLLAASGYHSKGNRRLYFPEFDVPGRSNGVALDADRDRSAGFLASASIGRMRVSGAFVDRTKRIPTASFATVFGDGREQTVDRRAYLDAAYTGQFGGRWSGVARAGLDYSGYAGTYPYDYGIDGVLVQDDRSDAVQASGELTLNRRGAHHLLTLGSEVRRTLVNHQFASDIYGVQVDERHPATKLGFYIQDQLTLRRWLLLNAGVRLDYDEAFGSSLTPRAGLVLLPRRQTAVKVLYGRAFRAPNSYELYYYDAMRNRDLGLEPETIDTTEVVWEEYIGAHLRTGLSLFHYDADRLIVQRSLVDSSTGTPTDAGLYFANANQTIANGVDAEIEGRWTSGLTAALGYSHVRASDGANVEVLSNSPRHLTNLRVSAPIKPLFSRLALDVRGVSARRDQDGGIIPGFVLGHATATTAVNKKLDVELGVYNLLNRRHADPGAEEHVQRSIEQDGRTFRVRVIARF
jgi:iron complex outermembrane receptor protein